MRIFNGELKQKQDMKQVSHQINEFELEDSVLNKKKNLKVKINHIYN